MSRLASAYHKAGPIIDGGLQLALSSAIGTLGGLWLDRRFGTGPWLLLAGALLGVGGGMYAFIRAALRVGRQPRGRE